ALLDQIREEVGSGAALAGNLRHQPEVALDQGPGDGRIVGLPVLAGELRFLLAAQERGVLEWTTQMQTLGAVEADRIHGLAVVQGACQRLLRARRAPSLTMPPSERYSTVTRGS